ncbi:hypothetical protein KQX64_04670 [Rhodopseudomonas palustris]|nr:hypothetical protein KQX64_04670 [Rhodopseudomonas palustris]
MKLDSGSEIRSALLVEHDKLLKRLGKWRAETTAYRWLNILLFMSCKTLVPTGALIVAANMISTVLDKPLFSNLISAALATFITFLASIEAMLNPGAKKRLAFNLNNELSSIENKLNIAKISSDNDDLQKKLIWADDEVKRLLNYYSDNGY